MKLEFDPVDFAPIIRAAVAETIAAIGPVAQTPERLAYTEAEAAELLGIATHVLRDARRRGDIDARRVGRKVLYSRETLMAYLAHERSG